LFANYGDDNAWNVLIVILGIPRLLLSRTGKFDQCFQSLDCYLQMSQESAADSCEVDMPDKHASAYLPRVWRWPVESGKSHDLQYLLLDLPDRVLAEEDLVQFPV